LTHNSNRSARKEDDQAKAGTESPPVGRVWLKDRIKQLTVDADPPAQSQAGPVAEGRY